TDANGNFTISGVGPGTHTLGEGVPSAYIETSPAGDGYSFITQSGANFSGQNFSNALPALTLDNDQSNYVNVPASQWSPASQGWEGTSRTHTATNNGKVFGACTLTHSGGFPQGTYEVFATYVLDTSGTQVTYKLYDGEIVN